MREYQMIKLTSAILEAPEDSELAAFRRFVAMLFSLQKQIESAYHVTIIYQTGC